MFGSKAVKPDVKVVSRFAHAAGTAGVFANLCLIAVYVLLSLQGGNEAGGSLLAGYAIVGLGLFLPWMSLPQRVVFGVGFLVALPACLGIPIWFLSLGRHLGASAG